jgi:hypothetical protein
VSYYPPNVPPPPPPRSARTKSRWGRATVFLGAHPTRRAGVNWAIWAVAVLVAIGVLGSVADKPATTTAADRNAPPSVSAPPSGTAPTRSTSTTAATTSRVSTTHTPTSSSAPRPVDSTGGVVVTAGGAVLPDHARTPGAVNPDVTQANITVTICVSGWTSTIRPPSSYTTALKEQQLATGYAYQGDLNPGDYEEDHLISLELGGSPRSQLNLWPEPYFTTDGAQLKDQIENKLHALVCDGALSLTAAQQAIATNWFTAYQTYIGTPAPATSSPSVPPPVTSTAPASPLTCSASMSNPHPADYSTTDVIVHTGVSGAAVTATAHYKSTDTTHTGTAADNGVADIAFRISRATPGYTVTVDVTVTAGGAGKSCSTSFTPQ